MACEKWIANSGASAGRPRVRCGEAATFLVIPGYGLEIRNQWYSCAEHAPEDSPTATVISLSAAPLPEVS
jgi:hypothetical protein